ncbi:MAG TPA: hypothetical protein VFF78_01350 [Anaerolineaceae bacterium]|nr:hypothetical protein [Anaerolineaceae bacterium]
MPANRYPTHSFLGALQVGVTLITSPLSRLWYNRWGATNEECSRTLPGDELVPNPKLLYTHAITMHASAAQVWPWLVQIGQGRGGLYSYDGLENLIGCDIHSADRIVPEFQNLKVGDHVLFGPAEKKFPGQVVAQIEPEKALVMYALDPVKREAVKTVTWTFILEQQDAHTTRLIARGRNWYADGFANALIWHMVEPVSFVMERRMFKGLKARVEDGA